MQVYKDPNYIPAIAWIEAPLFALLLGLVWEAPPVLKGDGTVRLVTAHLSVQEWLGNGWFWVDLELHGWREKARHISLHFC